MIVMIVRMVIVIMHGIFKNTHIGSFLTGEACSSCLFNPWCERYLKENSSSPQIVGGGVGFEFLSCFCAGFVCLLSEEAPENGAKFGAKSLSRAELGTQPVEFDTFVEEKTTTGLISDTNSSSVVSGVSLFSDHPKGTYIIGPVV